MSNTINMRTFGLKMIAGVAIAGCAVLSQAQSASALSLNFSPTGSNIDGDPINDIVTNVSDQIKFTLSLETGGVDPLQSLSQINYRYLWDNSELRFISFTSLLGTGSGGAGLPSPDNIIHTFAPNTVMGSNSSNYQIAEVLFEVRRGLTGNGVRDFRTQFVSAFGQNNAPLTSLIASQVQSVEVQDKVPTPALLPGIAAMGLGLLRKRQAKAANA
jgi:hypothetical protein